MTNKLSTRIENKSQLIKYFTDGIKKENQLRIGVEHEKFLFNQKNFKRIDYDQIKKIFETLRIKGWELQFEKDKVIGLMMYLGDPDDLDLIEHLLVENKEKCFEMKVIAEENSNAYYECAKLEAVVKEGKIIRIIEEIEVL